MEHTTNIKGICICYLYGIIFRSELGRPWSIYQPPLFLLSKTHKNKNKHPGGIIFLPDDQFGCSGQTTQN